MSRRAQQLVNAARLCGNAPLGAAADTLGGKGALPRHEARCSKHVLPSAAAGAFVPPALLHRRAPRTSCLRASPPAAPLLGRRARSRPPPPPPACQLTSCCQSLPRGYSPSCSKTLRWHKSAQGGTEAGLARHALAGGGCWCVHASEHAVVALPRLQSPTPRTSGQSGSVASATTNVCLSCRRGKRGERGRRRRRTEGGTAERIRGQHGFASKRGRRRCTLVLAPETALPQALLSLEAPANGGADGASVSECESD